MEGQRPVENLVSWEKFRERVVPAFHKGSLISLPLLFAMMIIGLVYFGSCPAENLLPIYLIVSGLFWMFFIFLRFCGNCCCRDDEKRRPYCVNAILGCLGFFLVCWFLSGTYWVVSVYLNHSSDINDVNYCNNILYQFCLWLTIVSDGLLIIFLFILACFGLIWAFTKCIGPCQEMDY